MKLYLIAEQYEGAEYLVFSTLAKAEAYIADKKYCFIVEVELDNDDPFSTTHHDPHAVIAYRL